MINGQPIINGSYTNQNSTERYIKTRQEHTQKVNIIQGSENVKKDPIDINEEIENFFGNKNKINNYSKSELDQ